ncbi:MAG: hypothetical protein WBA67_04365 [Jannaschia sp.]
MTKAVQIEKKQITLSVDDTAKAAIQILDPSASAASIAANLRAAGILEFLDGGDPIDAMADALADVFAGFDAAIVDRGGPKAQAVLGATDRGIEAVMAKFGVPTAKTAPEGADAFGLGLGRYMDGYGSTEGFDGWDFVAGVGKVVGGGIVTIGAVIAAPSAEVLTGGGSEGAIGVAIIGIGLIAGNIAYDGMKEVRGELEDGAVEILDAAGKMAETDVVHPEDGGSSDDEADMGDLPMGTRDDDGAETEEDGMVFTEEEVEAANAEDDGEDGSDGDTSSDDDADDGEDGGMVFTEEEVEAANAEDDGSDGGDGAAEAEDDQMPIGPDRDAAGGLSKAELMDWYETKGHYGSSTGAGVTMPADGMEGGRDTFVFKVNYNDSSGAGAMMPAQDDLYGPSREQVEKMLAGENYGSSTGAGVMMPEGPHADTGGGAGPLGGGPILGGGETFLDF